MSDEPSTKKQRKTASTAPEESGPGTILDEALWRIVWSFLDMSEAARVATVCRLFAQAPQHCTRRLTANDSRLLTPAFLWQLRKWLDQDQQPAPHRPSAPKKLELLYRLSRDGATPQAFHERCDDKGPTVTVVQFVENQGYPNLPQRPYIIGAYTDVAWKSPDDTSEGPVEAWDHEGMCKEINANNKTFLFAMTYARVFKDRWSVGEDAADGDEQAPPEPPVRKPFRFCQYVPNTEVLHGRGIGPGFFWNHEDAPALWFLSNMTCHLVGGAFHNLHEEATFECEDARVVEHLQETDRDILVDLMPFEFSDSEMGSECIPPEMEVFSVSYL